MAFFGAFKLGSKGGTREEKKEKVRKASPISAKPMRQQSAVWGYGALGATQTCGQQQGR